MAMAVALLLLVAGVAAPATARVIDHAVPPLAARLHAFPDSLNGELMLISLVTFSSDRDE